MRFLVPITDESALILPTRRRGAHVRGLGTMTPETDGVPAAALDLEQGGNLELEQGGYLEVESP
jgi:hypothetical protein